MPHVRAAAASGPGPRLGEVDQLEIEREGADDRLGLAELEAVSSASSRPRSSDRRRCGTRSSASRMRSTRSKSACPACSTMTWPSSAPSSRTSTRERVAGPAVPIPAARRTAGVTRRGEPLMRPMVRDRSGSEPAPAATSWPRPSLRLYRDTHDRIGSASTPARARPSARGDAPDADGQLDQLRFLHGSRGSRPPRGRGTSSRDGRRRHPRRPARRRLLALSARPGRSVPDARGDQRPRPLPDRPGPRPVRRGRHRRVAASSSPWSSRTSRPTRASCGSAASTSGASSPRCCPCRSPGTTRRSACSTSRPSGRGTFSRSDVAQLGAVADLLAGIVEKGRQQSEAEARVEALKAIDEARSELIALVTHELRTPLAVVRAYADLLAEEPPLDGRESRDSRAAGRGPPGTARPSNRSSASIGSSIRSSPRCGSCRGPPASRRSTSRRRRRGPRVARAAPASTTGRGATDVRAPGPGRPAAPPPDPRAPRRERRQVRPARHDHHGSIGRSSKASSSSASATRGRASPRNGVNGSSSPTLDGTPTPPAARGSGCMPPSASVNRWAPGCGASPRAHGARFVVALPAAVAV